MQLTPCKCTKIEIYVRGLNMLRKQQGQETGTGYQSLALELIGKEGSECLGSGGEDWRTIQALVWPLSYMET